MPFEHLVWHRGAVVTRDKVPTLMSSQSHFLVSFSVFTEKIKTMTRNWHGLWSPHHPHPSPFLGLCSCLCLCPLTMGEVAMIGQDKCLHLHGPSRPSWPPRTPAPVSPFSLCTSNLSPFDHAVISLVQIYPKTSSSSQKWPKCSTLYHYTLKICICHL